MQPLKAMSVPPSRYGAKASQASAPSSAASTECAQKQPAKTTDKTSMPLNERMSSSPLATLYWSGLSIVHALLPRFVKRNIEASFLFAPHTVKSETANWPEPLKSHAVTFLDTTGECQLQGAYFPAQAGKPTLLYNGGNMESISSGFSHAHENGWLKAGYGLLLWHYPQYGESTGKLNDATLKSSAEGALAFLNKQGVATETVVPVGYSLGGAAATHLASKYPVKALMLCAPFAGLRQMFEASRSDANVPSWLFPPKQSGMSLDNEAAIANVTCPVFITHGGQDKVIPEGQSLKLVAAATKAPKRVRHIVPHADHGTIRNPVFAHDVIDWLSQL